MNRAVRALKFGILVSLLSRVGNTWGTEGRFIVAVLAAWALWDVKL